MEWQQVMGRPDYTEREKRTNYEADCKRRGKEPFPGVYSTETRRDAKKALASAVTSV